MTRFLFQIREYSAKEDTDMQKKILLFAPSQFASLRKDKTFSEHAFYELGDPLGICYLGGMLKQKGYEVKLMHQVNKTNDEVLEEILEFAPDLVGISVMSIDYKTALDISKRLKSTRKNIPIIFGGYHATTHPEIVKEESIDAVVIGHGEYALLELAEHYLGNKRKRLGQIAGIAYFDNGVKITKRRVTSQEEFINIPAPLREGLPREHYLKVSFQEIPMSEMNYAFVGSSRGCPYSCSFCLNEIMNCRKINYFDVKKVVDEIEALVDNGVNYFFFADEAFTINKDHLSKLCNELINRGIPKKAKWGSFGAVEDICNKKFVHYLNLMREAGCEELQIGVESGDTFTLKAMNKHSTPSKAVSAFRNIREAGLLSAAYIIIGTPYETMKSLENTKKGIFRIKPDRISVYYEIPFKGCRDYEKYKNLIATTDADKFTSDEIILRNDVLDAQVKASPALKKMGLGNYRGFLRWKRLDIIRGWYGSKEFYNLQLQNLAANPKRFKCAVEWFKIVHKAVPEFKYGRFIRDAKNIIKTMA